MDKNDLIAEIAELIDESMGYDLDGFQIASTLMSRYNITKEENHIQTCKKCSCFIFTNDGNCVTCGEPANYNV